MTNEKFTWDLCVVGGAGHVGLPLAIAFASRGQNVLIYDLNEKVLETISQGIVPFMEEGAEPLLKQALRQKRLSLSSQVSDVAKARTLIITIGTPVDEFLNPTFGMMKQCLDQLIPHVSDDQMLILRSTVYPGTTKWLVQYLNSRGKNLNIAFCPERVVQGLAIRELTTFPQIISGVTPEAEDEAARLFALVAPELVRLTPMEAEFAKLFTNAYRYIQFAAANQFFMIANSAGVDFHKVLDGMQKGYPRARDIPRAGFAAGPCLFKDTMQLAAFSNNQFQLGQAAVSVNEGLILYIVDQIASKYELKNMTIGLLGMAFKPDVDDNRSSLSYKLKKVLEFQAREVLTTDPYVTTDSSLQLLSTVIKNSDLLILCVPHSEYKQTDFGSKPLVDVWSAIKSGLLV